MHCCYHSVIALSARAMELLNVICLISSKLQKWTQQNNNIGVFCLILVLYTFSSCSVELNFYEKSHTKMSCGTKTLKISSFVLDFLCCVSIELIYQELSVGQIGNTFFYQVFSALSIAACSYALAVFPRSEAIRIPCILGIVLGILLFGSTIFGCIAALRENIRLNWIVSIASI